MGSGFRPHDRDRTTESMEGVWMGYWAMVKRGWAAKRGVSGYAVNRWGIKRNPNAKKMDRGSTTLKQHRTPSFIPFREHFYATYKIIFRRCRRRVRVWLGSEWTTKRTGGTRTDASSEKHADEMQMMTWQNATRKQMTWQQ